MKPKKIILSALLFFAISCAANDGIVIYVMDNGVHTEILVPIANHIIDWREFVPLEILEYPEPERFNYLGFGWGDRSFYIHTPAWEDLDPLIAFAALFLPTRAVMKVEGYLSVLPGEFVKEVVVSDAGYRELTSFIRNSFRSGPRQQLIHTAEGYTEYESFFEARGRYFFLNTSNTWTAKALRKAGIPMPRMLVFSWDVMNYLN